MADNLIGAAPAGQPVTVSGGDSPSGQSPAEQAQPQVNYVTSEQLNAAMDEMRRMVQGDAVPMRKMKWVNGSWLSMADEYVHAMKPAKDPDAEEEPEPQDVTVRNCATYLKTVRDTSLRRRHAPLRLSELEKAGASDVH